MAQSLTATQIVTNSLLLWHSEIHYRVQKSVTATYTTPVEFN